MPPTQELSPIQYFKMFWDDEMTTNLANQTNIYSVQKIRENSSEEIEKFIGMQMLMSIVSLPSYEMYWLNDLRIDCIADTMGLKWYEAVRWFLHANDNTRKKDDSSRLFKIEPIIDGLRKNCLKIEPEKYQSIDEQMVPAKTKRSRIRQYVPKKIHK